MRFIFILFFLFSSLNAVEIEWADDYRSALKTAKKEHKDVMMMFSKENCQICEDLTEKVFSDEAFVNYINKNYISLEIDIEYDSRRGYKVYSTPTFYFVTPPKDVLGRIVVERGDIDSFVENVKAIK